MLIGVLYVTRGSTSMVSVHVAVKVNNMRQCLNSLNIAIAYNTYLNLVCLHIQADH